ncbi:MAG TPA: RNA polymerase sigma factor [Thermoanaerobaculia bacterium]|nr:RNA polymerase sigma factor [Thermoanaerobaculia bacterium]
MRAAASPMTWSRFAVAAVTAEPPTGARDAEFAALYAATARPLWGYLRAACGDPATADDLLQESYLRWFESDPARRDAGGQRAYLFAIATNLLRDRWRRGRRAPDATPLGDGDAAAPAGGDAVATRVDVQRALAQLPPRERQLLWLAHVEGLNHQEVAQVLGLRPASVRVLLFRARRRLAGGLGAGAEARP